MEPQKIMIYIGIVLIFTLVLIVFIKYEKYDGDRYLKVTSGYTYPNPLLLPPNPPTVNWFDPTVDNRSSEEQSPSESGMHLPQSTVMGPSLSGVGVGYTDERGWIRGVM